jgi:cAMP-dependent protein kinase regulator
VAAELLCVAPFLSELSREELNGLADVVAVSRFGAGEVVIAEGAPGECLFIVSKGILTVQTTGPDGNQVTIGTLAAGDFFGEISILLDRPRTATVSAETEVICLEIGREDWNRLQTAHPRMRTVLDDALQARAANSAGAVVEDYRRRRAEGKAGA